MKWGPHFSPPAPGHPEARKGSAAHHGERWLPKPCPSLGHLVLGRGHPLADTTGYLLLVNSLNFVTFSLSPKS